MKKILVPLFSLMISFNAYGEWTEITKNIVGITYHLDLDLSNIKQADGYIYYWEWDENLKPTVSGNMGYIVYNQGDCKVGRTNALSVIAYQNPRLKGQGEPYNPPVNWVYHTPSSVGEALLDYICNYVK